MHRDHLPGPNERSHLAPWIVAGALLLATSAPVMAQEATPAPDTGLEIATLDATPAPDDGAEIAAQDAAGDDDNGVGGGTQPSAVPATGAGPMDNGYGALAIGAAVAAAAAAAAALRQRLSGG